MYQGTTANLLNEEVLAFGWGPYGPGKVDNRCHKAWKKVFNVTPGPGWDPGDYQGSLVDNAGTSCPGDSGGPDFVWGGSNLRLTGIHSKGDDTCNGGIDGNSGAEGFRDFVAEWGNKCWIPDVGWTDWSACN